MRSFFMKMRGEGKGPPRVLLKEVLVSWVGAFLGIFAVGFLGHLVHLEQQDILFLIGSFGASAVLLYGTPAVPLAQPRNLMDGHILSALTGVLMNGWIAEPLYLSGQVKRFGNPSVHQNSCQCREDVAVHQISWLGQRHCRGSVKQHRRGSKGADQEEDVLLFEMNQMSQESDCKNSEKGSNPGNQNLFQ